MMTAHTNFHLQHSESNAVLTLRTVLLFLIVTAIIFSNIINIHMLRKSHELQLFSRVLLINLSVAGLINGFLVCLPGLITSALNKWPFGIIYCALSSISHGSSSSVTIWCLAAISMDRYVAMHHPVFYRNSNKTRVAAVAIVFFWALGIIFFSVPLAHERDELQYKYHLLICTMIRDPDIFGIITGFCMYIVSAIVLFFSSYKVMVTLKKIKTTKMNKKVKIKNCRNANAIRILLISGVSYFISWGPCTVTEFLIAFGVINRIPYGMEFVITWLANSNSFMNVLIYSGSSSEFRRRLKKFLMRCLMRKDAESLRSQMQTSMMTSFSN